MITLRKYDYSSLSRVPRVSATRVSVAFHSWAATAGPFGSVAGGLRVLLRQVAKVFAFDRGAQTATAVYFDAPLTLGCGRRPRYVGKLPLRRQNGKPSTEDSRRFALSHPIRRILRARGRILGFLGDGERRCSQSEEQAVELGRGSADCRPPCHRRDLQELP
ncbi:hypothetical protein BHE74_00030025 [Ensete ventricosum]|nr:hypothetical protein BHE74_00030025 [Ensete ventricosum]